MTMTLQRLKQMLKLDGWSNLAKQGWTKLLAWRWDELLLYGLMLSVVVLLLSACAMPSVLPTEPAKNPQPPQLSEPLPLENYSKSAAERIKSWAERLMLM
jgi:hypothetical protein